MVTGPDRPGPLVALHNVGTLIWLPMIAIHAVAYIRRIPRPIAADLEAAPKGPAADSRLRLGVNLGALFVGAGAAILVLPTDVPWVVWAQSIGQAPARLIVGTVVAVIALVAVRPLRWT